MVSEKFQNVLSLATYTLECRLREKFIFKVRKNNENGFFILWVNKTVH